MEERNITVKIADGKFSYRVGAIIINSDKFLLVKNSKESFFYTVGGRIKFGETAEEAVLRESFEETGIQLEIDRLTFIQENFFTMESSKEKYHELVFYYLMKNNETINGIKNKIFTEEYDNAILNWYKIDNLDKMIVYPDFLKKELHKFPKNIKHFITKDGKTTEGK